MKDLILKFMQLITEAYPQINICYEYDDFSDIYWIYHDNDKLAYETPGFHTVVGEALKRVFYNNSIFNVCFTFNYEYATRTAKEKFEKFVIKSTDKVEWPLISNFQQIIEDNLSLSQGGFKVYKPAMYSYGYIDKFVVDLEAAAA